MIVGVLFISPAVSLAEEVLAEREEAVQTDRYEGDVSEDSPRDIPGEEPQDVSGDVPIIEVEVSENKRQDLTIGQAPDAEGVHNYVVTNSTTGSKTEAESKDVPQTIAVVGQKVLQEQNADTVEKALANIAGVNTGTGVWNPNANLNPSFFTRGFSSNNYYFDGLYDMSGGIGGGWLGYLDRVEVLKGPSSLFFGSLQPGGVINFVTKKPLTKEAYSIGLSYGSWGSASVELDMSVPLTEDKRWLSRTIIETDKLEQFQRNVNNKHFNGSIIIQGKPKDNTVYTFHAIYKNYNLAGGYIGAQPTVGTILPPFGLLPYDANYYDTNMRYYYIGRGLSGRVDHKVNDTWTISSALHYNKSHNDRSYIGDERWYNNDPASGKIRSYYSWSIFDTETFGWDTTGNAKFKAFGKDHNLVLGYNWSRYYRTWPVSAGVELNPVDVYNPIFDPRPDIPVSSREPFAFYRYGSYLSDTVNISDKLKVSAGINHSIYSEGIGGNANNRSSGTTWRLGTTYDSSSAVTWFAGYGTSFEYNSAQTVKVGGNNVGVQTFDPRKGAQIEGGVKYNIRDKAGITLSKYKIYQTNIIHNMGSANDTDYQAIGEQTSEGYELDANYVVKPGWNMLFAYSNNSSKVSKNPTNPALIGKQTVSVPKESFKLWTTYEFQDGPLKGVGVGGGATYVDDRPFNSDNSVWVPSYTVFDAVLYYKTKGWNYCLNVNNLTNNKYWYAQTGVGVYAGATRNYTLRMSKSF